MGPREVEGRSGDHNQNTLYTRMKMHDEMLLGILCANKNVFKRGKENSDGISSSRAQMFPLSPADSREASQRQGG